jgi:putative ABC transport system permease protein
MRSGESRKEKAMIPFRYNLRSLVVRKTTTFATAFGIALVVFVLAAALMLSKGIKKTLASSGRSDQAIVLRKGSDTELNSVVESPNVGLILAAPGVKHDDKGRPIGIGEVVIVAAMEKIGDVGMSNVPVRGVPDDVLSFRPTVHVLDGRPAKSGTDEVIIGKGIRGRFKGLDLGQSFEIRKNRKLQVVGVFEDGGSSFESEVWADLDTIRSSFGREGIVSSVRVRLESESKYDVFRAAVESDKNLGFEAMRETEYYAKQSENLATFLTALGSIISFFFGIGAMIGAAITMYASIAARQREIGTLRALGFSRSGILTSFLLESVVLALAGGVVGALASIALGAVRISLLNFASWSEIVFSFDPNPATIAVALAFAGAMGLLGGFFPALRAARVSPIEAMRG